MPKLFIRNGVTVFAAGLLILGLVSPAAAAPPDRTRSSGWSWVEDALARLWSPLAGLLTGPGVDEPGEAGRPPSGHRIIGREESTVGPDWDPDGLRAHLPNPRLDDGSQSGMVTYGPDWDPNGAQGHGTVGPDWDPNGLRGHLPRPGLDNEFQAGKETYGPDWDPDGLLAPPRSGRD